MLHAARQLPAWLTYNVRQRMKVPTIIPALVTIGATAAYFSPWYAANPWSAIGWHYPALLWFLVAWMLIPIHGFLAVRAKKKNEANWRWHVASGAVIAILWGGVAAAAMFGYIVSV